MKNWKLGLGVFAILIIFPVFSGAEGERIIEVHVECTTREVVVEIDYVEHVEHEAGHYVVEISSPDGSQKLFKTQPYSEDGNKLVITESDMEKLTINVGDVVQIRVTLVISGEDGAVIIEETNNEATRAGQDPELDGDTLEIADFSFIVEPSSRNEIPATITATNRSEESEKYVYQWTLTVPFVGTHSASPRDFEGSGTFTIKDVNEFGTYSLKLFVIDGKSSKILDTKEEVFELTKLSPKEVPHVDKDDGPIIGVGPSTRDESWQSEKRDIVMSVNVRAENPGLDVATFSWDSPALRSDTKFEDRDTTKIPGEGAHFLYLFARDHGGNISQRKFGPFKYDAGPPIISSIGVTNSNVDTGESFRLTWGIVDHGSGLGRVDLWMLGPGDNDYEIWQELPIQRNSLELKFPTPGSRTFFITATDQAGNSISREKGQEKRMGVNVSIPSPFKDSIIKDFFIDANEEKTRSGNVILRVTPASSNMGSMHWVLDSPTIGIGIDEVKVQRAEKDGLSCINWKTVKEEDYNNTSYVDATSVIDDFDPGFYCYRAVVVDQAGNKTTSNEIRAHVIRDRSGNDAPVPVIDILPLLIQEGNLDPLSFTFDASRSKDPEGDRFSYEWHFPDGTILKDKRVVYSFSSSGTYKVELVLTDSRGNSASEEKKVEIPADLYDFDETPPEAKLRIIEKGPHMVKGVFKGGLVKLDWTISDSGIKNSGIREAFVSSNRAKQFEILPNPTKGVLDNEGFLYGVADGKTFIRLEVTDRAGHTTFSSIEIDENFLSPIEADGPPMILDLSASILDKVKSFLGEFL